MTNNVGTNLPLRQAAVLMHHHEQATTTTGQTRHHARRRRRLLIGLGAGVVAALALTGCSQGAPSEPGVRLAAQLPSDHVHGVGRDTGTGQVSLATHEGLFVLQSDKNWTQVGPVVDLMGFAISGPGTFYASGHPADGVDLPTPVGLMKSTDAGRTWTVLSRGGQSDFHALTASSKGVMGFDGSLGVTSDGKTWTQGGLTLEPRSLASAPDGSRVLATTAQGVFSTTDGGGTWTPLASAPPLMLVAWADPETIVGITPEGGLAVSTDAGVSWKSNPGRVSSGQAISASRDKTGVLEILVVTDTRVVQSRDSGATFADLTE